jgi:hypothetical protein
VVATDRESPRNPGWDDAFVSSMEKLKGRGFRAAPFYFL